DATNGAVLRRWNRLHFSTEPITFRVYTNDSPAPMSPGRPTPDGVQAPFVPRSLVTVDPSDINAFSPNGWIDDRTNQTRGHNVNPHLDVTPDNKPDLPRPAGSPYRVFDFPLDTTMEPSTYQSASVTQLFYLANRYHDRLFAMGFNEAARNFQIINFSGSGTGNDPVQADCQDGSGTNNANFSTSGTDGTSARCQMYLFTGSTPDRDGSLDADIVNHELTHGLSIRLHRGTLTGAQGGGMGEGWSDYFAISLNAESTDDPHAVYPMSGYATYQLWTSYVDNYYFGIRRYPYSTDLNKNPQTFKMIDPAQLVFPPSVPRNANVGGAANEVHNVGEVWCMALLECRAAMWDVYGFAGNQ